MNSIEKFGHELSEKVYGYLIRNIRIDYCHYGYCGVGFVLEDNKVLYTHFDEWLTYRHGMKYVPGGEYVGIIRAFYSKVEFIDWLSEQSDYSLSGFETGDNWYVDNQRVTRKRLLHLIENCCV